MQIDRGLSQCAFREREIEGHISNSPQCNHGHNEQQRCNCNQLYHVTAFEFPPNEHHNILRVAVFAACKARWLRSKLTLLTKEGVRTNENTRNLFG